MTNNKYIQNLADYINKNTPIKFNIDTQKYEEINEIIQLKKHKYKHKEVITAAYSLFYTSINYHKQASTNKKYQSYYILIGDYINSYITELLYKNQLFELLKIFGANSKIIMLDHLNKTNNDELLKQILSNILGDKNEFS